MIDISFLDKKDFGKYKPEHVATNYGALKTVLLALGKKFDPNFDIKPKSDEAELYDHLLYYFCDDPKCKWDLSKGLFLSGSVGVGKSMSLKLLQQLYLCGYNVPPMQRRKFFKTANMEALSVKRGKLLANLDEFYQNTDKNLFCDEVMRESKDSSKNINNFGTIEQPFSVGVHQMYRNFADKGMLYHFTTNYWSIDEYPNGSLFEKTYGKEIKDRLVEMCNIIEIKGKSKRV